jgi:hypothetical protein
MSQTIPTQHPTVVLRSHFERVRALLAVALIAVVGLSIALVIVANDEDQVSGTSAARPAESIRYGGFNPATGTPDSAPAPQREAQAPVTGSRYDGGPDEGASGKDDGKNGTTGDTAAGSPESLNGPGARTD